MSATLYFYNEQNIRQMENERIKYGNPQETNTKLNKKWKQ